MQTNLTPFAELRARTFLWRALLAFIYREFHYCRHFLLGRSWRAPYFAEEV